MCLINKHRTGFYPVIKTLLSQHGDYETCLHDCIKMLCELAMCYINVKLNNWTFIIEHLSLAFVSDMIQYVSNMAALLTPTLYDFLIGSKWMPTKVIYIFISSACC